VIQEFYDAAVSGADPIDARTAFTDMMAFCGNGGPKVVLVENASRFARDLIVQLTGHEMMKKAGIELIPPRTSSPIRLRPRKWSARSSG
jgi:DNA invertase Pin-like site-specific DNA recombinase